MSNDYAQNAARLVPGFADLHRMSACLLAEHAAPDGHILILGAGGGYELQFLAQTQPNWQFTGVDPNADMLALTATKTAAHADRITLHQGYIDTAPSGPFDGATCILTLHFVPKAERVATLIALRERLKPAAPLVVAQHSIQGDLSRGLSRYAAFAASNGVPLDNAQTAAKAIAERLPIQTPQQDEANLAAAGFTNITPFYAAFTFRGWVATAP
jgi:tRNA (cmo5U34)-methyltransferase